MTRFILYFMLMSGPAAGAAILKKRSGCFLPLTALVMIFVLYIGAIAGGLQAAVYAVCALTIAAWLAAGGALLRTKDVQGFARRLLTPAHAVFTLLFAFSALGSRGMPVHQWDEFSHWAYSVQEMLLGGQLYTSALSDSLFKTYPPLMPLWQYLWQQLNVWLCGAQGMDGALLYTTSQMLAFALFMPFLGKLNWKKPVWIALAFAGILGLPLIVYTDFYSLLYIDGFLGLLAGAAFAVIALRKWKKPLGAVLLMLLESALVLTKDSGLFFAAASLVYLAVLVLREKKWQYAWVLAGAVLMTVLAKASWGLHLSACQLKGSSSFDLQGMWRLFSGQEPDSYRWQVMRNFAGFVFSDYLRLTVLRLPVTYFLMLVLLLTASWVALPFGGKERVWLLVFEGVCAAAYLAGLLFLYLFHFGEYGGLTLISAARYTKTLILCLVMIAGACTLNRLGRAVPARSVCVLLAVMLLMPSWGEALKQISGESAAQAQAAAQTYRLAGEIIGEKTQGSAHNRQRVYLILQQDDDQVYYGTRYYARPYAQVNWLNWHLGAENYSEAYNIWAMTPELWEKTLCEGYDYVYVGASDAYFREAFGHLFDGEIKENSVYAVERAGNGSVLLTLR